MIFLVPCYESLSDGIENTWLMWPWWVKTTSEGGWNREVKIFKDVQMSDGSWRFSCGDVYSFQKLYERLISCPCPEVGQK